MACTMKNKPGQSCCGECAQDCVVDAYVGEPDWVAEAGSVTFVTGSPPSPGTTYAETASDGALIVRENDDSVYRWHAVHFKATAGAPGDATIYLGMRTADGDSVRVEVAFDRKAASDYTVTVIETVGGVDTTIDGPHVMAWNAFLTLDVTVVICFDPDYETLAWLVISPNSNSNAMRLFGIADCSLALRDLIAGTVTLNGQTVRIGWESIPQYRHAFCAVDTVTHAPLQATVTLAGLTHTSQKMHVEYAWGLWSDWEWLAEFAHALNGSYDCYGYNGGLVGDSGFVAHSADLDRWKSGAYFDTVTGYSRIHRAQFYVTYSCTGGQTTIWVELHLTDEAIGSFPGYPPWIHPPADWYWKPGAVSEVILFQKTFSGDFDLRTLEDEEIPLVAGTGSDYLDWSGATVKLSAVTAP